ncbi:hypothetical protein D9M73_224100 [compost metagenome]
MYCEVLRAGANKPAPIDPVLVERLMPDEIREQIHVLAGASDCPGCGISFIYELQLRKLTHPGCGKLGLIQEVLLVSRKPCALR